MVFLVATACGPGGLSEDDVSGSWQLVEGTVAGQAMPSVEGHAVTLDLQPDGTVSGSAACNSYATTYDLVDGRLVIGNEMSMTAMGCAPDVTEVESAYTTALTRITEAQLEDNLLILTGPDVTLRFEPAGH